MKEQPWCKDKRSWIFYLDQIKDDENIVWGETEEGIFLLDCETARLSIWSKKWQTFTDIGISNLLKRMSKTWNESNRESLGGTHIFYKGIELQNKCIVDDTELLEFIDIKGGLDRSYINISRNGFTEAGELYFKEKLYPALMSMIQEVLRELERGADQTKFDTKIGDVVKRLCKESKNIDTENLQSDIIKNREALIALVGSVAVLSYLAMRDEWNVWEELGGRYPRKGTWEKLLKDIDEYLNAADHEELLDQLATMTALFGIKVYSEDYKEEMERGEGDRNRVNFLNIFSNNNHWAILQCRRNSYSTWVSHLVRLEGESDIFLKLTDISRREKSETELEKWGRKMCSVTSAEQVFTMHNFQQQMLLEWMLKNIPTIGLFCNEQGNVRLNVLVGRIYPSLYLDKNFKCLILERMIKKAEEDDIQRFSTIAWRGREYISCDELPFSVYFIKRGYLSDHSYHKCIVPLEGGVLRVWGKALKKSEESEFAHKVALLLQDMDIMAYFERIRRDKQSNEDKEIWEYLKTSSTNASVELISEVWDRIFKRINERDFKVQMSLEDLLNNEERRKKWKRIYAAAAKIHVMDVREESDDMVTGSLEKEIQDGDGLDMLCDAWLYCCIFKEAIVGEGSEIRKIYEDYTKDHETSEKKNENVVKYIASKKGIEFSMDALKAGIDDYREEIIELAQELEMRPIQQYLRNNMRKNSVFVSKIKSEYQKYQESLTDKGTRCNIDLIKLK